MSLRFDVSVRGTMTGSQSVFCKTQDEPDLKKVDSLADLTLEDYTTKGRSGSQEPLCRVRRQARHVACLALLCVE